MKHVKLVNDLITNNYNYRKSSDIQMSMLGDFLRKDVNSSTAYVRQWLCDKNNLFLSGHAVKIEKKRDEITFSLLNHDEDDEPPYPELAFHMSSFCKY